MFQRMSDSRGSHPGQDVPDGHVFTRPRSAGPTGQRRDQVISCQYRAERARLPARRRRAGRQGRESRRREDPVKRDRLVRLSGGTPQCQPDPARGYGGSIRRSGMTYHAPFRLLTGASAPFEDHLDAERSMNTCCAPRRASPAIGCRRTYSPSGRMSHAEQLSCS